MVSGVMCNIALMRSARRQSALRTSPTYVLLYNLSLVDLSLLLVGLIKLTKELIGCALFNQIWCSEARFLVSFSSASCVLQLVTFSVFRYLVLTRPLSSLVKIASKTRIFFCMAICAVGLILSVPVIFLSGINNLTTSDKGQLRDVVSIRKPPSLFPHFNLNFRWVMWSDGRIPYSQDPQTASQCPYDTG